jgi:hypothetical protein
VTKFSVGDEVIVTTRNMRATVEYGPFDCRDPEVYVVKLVDEPTDPDDVRTFTSLASVMKPAPKFSVGDKITGPSCVPGTLTAGPFKRPDNSVFWVVEREGGYHAAVGEVFLMKTPEPEPVKVGDRVRVVEDDRYFDTGRFVGLVGTVTDIGESRTPYLVKFGDGDHGEEDGQWYCAEVKRVTDEDVYEYDGVVYDLSAKYRDRDGDVWQFNRKRRGGVPNMYIDDEGNDWDTIESVYRSYGPLTRVTD